MSNLIPFFVVGESHYINKRVSLDSRTNGWTAVNRGTSTVRVNGIPLSPSLIPGTAGESVSIGGNIGEIWSEKDLQIVFEPMVGGSNEVLIIQKYYTF